MSCMSSKISKDFLDLHAPFLDLGKIEDVIDQARQFLAVFDDAVQILLLLVLARIRGIQKKIRITQNHSERSANLMAHVRKEGGLGSIRRFRPLRLGAEAVLFALLLGDVHQNADDAFDSPLIIEVSFAFKSDPALAIFQPKLD